ncbi:hypothetical protein H5410_056358, partial [Solanum commersonii]
MAAAANGRAPFEAVQPAPLPQTTTYATLFNSNTINRKQSALINSKTIAKSIEIIHGEPTITLSMEERQDFMNEEGLDAVVFKLSHGAPDLKVIRDPQCRFFSWSIGYNPKEETTLAMVWISLLNLSPDLFAKKSLLSIAPTIGKPIAIEKATQIKSRPSTSRVKVILDLMEKLPNRIRLQFVDGKSGKLIEHQGHDEDSCCLISKRNQNNKQIDDTFEVASKGTIDSEKYQGDVREILNEKRKVADVDQRGTPRVGVDAPQVGACQKIIDSGHTLMDTSDVEDAENSGKHVLQVETKNATKNWTPVAHKNSTSNRSLSPTSQNNSPRSEKGATGNFMAVRRDKILVMPQETYYVSPPTLNSKLSPKTPVCVPKCVIANNNESRALVSNMFDLGEDSLDEDEEGKLDICFDRVAREGDISPRQQISGSNKRKKKTHGMQYSWDGSTRSNKSIKKVGIIKCCWIGLKKKTREKYFKLLLMDNQSFLIHAFVIESLRLIMESYRLC